MDELVFKILRRVVVLSLFIVGSILLLFKDPKTYVIGYLAGAVISGIMFLLIKNTVVKSVRMSPKQATIFTVINYIFRMIIYALTIYMGAVVDYMDLISVIVGILSVKFVIYLSAISNKI